MVKERVGPDDIAEVISAWTGIPAGRLLQGETEKLLSMESIIGARLIGQAGGAAVSDAVRRAGPASPTPTGRPGRSSSSGRPVSARPSSPSRSPTSSSTTSAPWCASTCRSTAERHAVARLIGAPPGYVGYDEGGQLTEAVRRRPYSVVLLDEVEKAHPETFDILLQVLDDGRLTDGQGRTVDFRNVILVLTSNLGCQFLIDPTLSRSRSGTPSWRRAGRPSSRSSSTGSTRSSSSTPLPRTSWRTSSTCRCASSATRLRDRRITLEVTDAARDWLAKTGYDPAYGARPLRRLVQREIGDRLARALLAGQVRDGDTVTVAGRMPRGPARGPAPEGLGRADSW
jgi:ATP-dependent Clp protease ATP-binding subunit ClpB